jgi:hypothetical protein
MIVCSGFFWLFIVVCTFVKLGWALVVKGVDESEV